MDRNEELEIIDGASKLEFEAKKQLFNKVFSLGNFNGLSVNDKLILISLVSFVYLRLKSKNSEVTPLRILMKLTNQKPDNSFFYQMLESLSIWVEEFSYDSKDADSCGLKTSDEIYTKIKELLNTWTPF